MSAVPPETRTGARPSNRRSVIRDNAAALFAQRGVAGTSVREIADTVGILSGSLYHHFASKDEIVDEIITMYLDDLLRRYGSALAESQDPRAAVETLIRVSLEVIRDHPHATQIYQNDATYIRGLPSAEHTKNVAAEIQQMWLDVIERGIASGAFRSSLDAKVVYRLLRDAIWLTLRWFNPTGEFTLDHLAEECIVVFLDGIAQD